MNGTSVDFSLSGKKCQGKDEISPYLSCTENEQVQSGLIESLHTKHLSHTHHFLPLNHVNVRIKKKNEIGRNESDERKK